MSKTAFMALAISQMQTRRWKECEQSANDLLKALPSDPDAMRMIQGVAERQADWKKAALISKRIAASRGAESGDLNNQAWYSLFDGSVGEEALQTAQKASMLAQNADSAALHTLATIQAELGNTTEARGNLLQSMQIRGMAEPDSDCWYVFARIAEQFGEREAALNIYKRVTAPEGGEVTPSDVLNLAHKRIKILERLGK